MAHSPKLANLTVNAEAEALSDLFDTGYLRIYSGTKPVDADTALSGNTLLAELRFGNPAFGAAVNGVLTANALTQDSSADATGTATFFRAFRSDGTTVIMDGEVGVSGSDLNLNSVAIQAGTIVQVTSMIITVSKG